jgi:hypothetical protein
MSNLTATVTPFAAQVVAALPGAQNAVVVDVGGSLGQLLQGVLDVLPQATGVLFDLAPIIADAKAAMPVKYQGRVQCESVSPSCLVSHTWPHRHRETSSRLSLPPTSTF